MRQRTLCTGPWVILAGHARMTEQDESYVAAHATLSRMALDGRQIPFALLLAVFAGATACRSGSAPVAQPASRSEPVADERFEVEQPPLSVHANPLPLRRGTRVSGQGFTIIYTDVRKRLRYLELAGILMNTGTADMPVGSLQLYLDNTPEVEKRRMDAYIAENGHSADITAGSKYEALVHTHVLKPGQSQPFRVKWPVYEHDLPSSPLKELFMYPQFTKTNQESR